MRPSVLPARAADPLRRLRSTVLAAALVLAVIGSGVPATAESGRALPPGFTLHDDETVYVVADALGAPRETVVVSWLRLEGNGTVDVSDPGEVQAAEALEDDLEPRVGPGGVAWTLDVEGRRDFFYRADTRAELPVRVTAAYFLDGEEVHPDDLAGADGRVRIEVTVENTLRVTEDVTYADADGLSRTRQAEYWVPMLAPVMIELDGRRFSDIESDAQIVNVSGSTVSHTFMAFPQPSTTVTIEMTGTDIAIEPIVVSVYPMMADSPDFSAAEHLAELRAGLEGLSRLSDGHRQALGAMADSIDSAAFGNVEQAAVGFERLAAGAGELGEGT
ncbi:MAG TPA: hypothetical protein VFH17_00635, partial [Coriobacteriia bacterium]|nr:hypothetical protein [Coriobacteriia bacterium]